MTTQNNNIPEGYKNSALGVIPEEWEVKRLGEICSKIGSGITPKGGESVYKSHGHFFIRSQNVGWGNLLLDDVAFIDDVTHNKQISTELIKNDILLNITGASIGRSTIVTEEITKGNVNQHVCIIRLKDKTLPRFVCSYLLSNTGQKLIDSYQAGGNRQGLNFEQIKSFFIPLPPLPEQQRIATLLSVWDTAIEKQTKLVAALQTRKRALMQQLLTGKKRLPGFVGEWEKVKLGEVGCFIKGKGVPKDKITDNGNLCLTYGDLYTKFENCICNIRQFIDDETARLSQQIIFGDILFAGSGETLIDIGKNATFIEKEVAYAGGDIIILRPTREINSFVVSSILNSDIGRKQKYKAGQGHSVVHIYTKDLQDIEFELPSLNEQTAIASVLTTADKEIRIAETHLAQMRQQKKGLMQVLLTGKKRVKN